MCKTSEKDIKIYRILPHLTNFSHIWQIFAENKIQIFKQNFTKIQYQSIDAFFFKKTTLFRHLFCSIEKI